LAQEAQAGSLGAAMASEAPGRGGAAVRPPWRIDGDPVRKVGKRCGALAPGGDPTAAPWNKCDPVRPRSSRPGGAVKDFMAGKVSSACSPPWALGTDPVVANRKTAPPGRQPAEGWQPKVPPPGAQQVCYNPLLHRHEIYVREEGGSVARAAPGPGGEPQRRPAENRPRSMGRRKGLAEYEDLCGLNRPNWNPKHQAALEQDRRAFHRRIAFEPVRPRTAAVAAAPQAPPVSARGSALVEPVASAWAKVPARPSSAPSGRSRVSPSSTLRPSSRLEGTVR